MKLSQSTLGYLFGISITLGCGWISSGQSVWWTLLIYFLGIFIGFIIFKTWVLVIRQREQRQLRTIRYERTRHLR